MTRFGGARPTWAGALATALAASCANVEVAPHHGGSSGDTGTSGAAGTSGVGGAAAGSSGAFGGSGASGVSGASGATGISGASGAGASSGASGAGGASGASGSVGASGVGGTTGGIPIPTTYTFDDGTSMNFIPFPSDAQPAPAWSVVADPANAANMVYQEGVNTSDLVQAVGGDSNWVDVLVQTKVTIVSLTDGARIYLNARWQAEKTQYFTYLQADGSLKFGKRVNGSTTYYGTTYKTNIPLAPGATYTVGLSVKGSTVSAFLNQVPAGSMADADAAPLLRGGISLGVQEVVAQFDDISITLPP